MNQQKDLLYGIKDHIDNIIDLLSIGWHQSINNQ
jgi:hypothetical protein